MIAIKCILCIKHTITIKNFKVIPINDIAEIVAKIRRKNRKLEKI